jgi:hypothetical protein
VHGAQWTAIVSSIANWATTASSTAAQTGGPHPSNANVTATPTTVPAARCTTRRRVTVRLLPCRTAATVSPTQYA